jgi:PadR family transcriptional regulator PadR
MKGDFLGSFETLFLAVLKILGPKAYGMTIHEKMEELLVGSRIVSLGAVYTTMDRLESKGYVKTWHGGASPQRGGRKKRYANLTKAGEAELKRSLEQTVTIVRELGWLERRGLQALGKMVMV